MNPVLVPAIVTPIVEAARSLLDRLFPDPAERARAELELLKAQADGTFAQKAEQALALAQIEVNKTEAATDGYRGGWRPFVGWTCAAALAWQFVVRPMVAFGFTVAGHPLPELPSIDGALWELLFGMLGLGAMRTFEKVRDKA